MSTEDNDVNVPQRLMRRMLVRLKENENVQALGHRG